MDMKNILQKLDTINHTKSGNSSDIKNILTKLDSISSKKINESKKVEKPKTLLEQYIEKQSIANDKLNHSKKQNLIKKSKNIANKVMLKENSASIYDIYEDPMEEPTDNVDAVDTVTIDVPLLIRLLEYAREDAESDMDLHNVSEMLINLSKEHDILSMDQYDQIIGNQKQLPSPT